MARVLYSPKERFRTVVLPLGDSVRFGRDERALVRVADPELLGAHFELIFDGDRFHAFALGGAPLRIEGRADRCGALESGSFLTAGGTTVIVSLEADPSEVPALGEGARAALALVAPARDKGALYALVDAARRPAVLRVLREAIDPHESLFDGAVGAALDEVAPYLVHFAPDSRLLERLLADGWGDGWATYFVADGAPRVVRRHFRRFLMVVPESNRERLYFRFYDPRVLREFLPLATLRQRQELFGSLSRDEGSAPGRYLIEAMVFESSTGDPLREAPVAANDGASAATGVVAPEMVGPLAGQGSHVSRA